MTTLEQARDLFERENKTLEQKKTWLYDAQGKQIYAKAEHDRRMAELLAPLQSAREVIAEEAARTVEVAKEAVAVGDLPAIAHMSTEQLQRMVALKQVLGDSVTQSSFAELLPTLQAVARHDDVAMKAAFSGLVQAKFEAIRSSGANLSPHDAQGITGAMDTVRAIHKSLIPPEVSKTIAAAQQTMVEAAELNEQARSTLAQADGSAAAALANWESEIRSW